MKVTFVYRGYQSLGIEYLSAVLKKAGHRTNLVFDPALFDDNYISVRFLNKLFDYRKKVINEVIASKPDLILFSVVSDEYTWACNTAKKIKELVDIPIIFGGIHVTSVPEIVIKNDFVDYIIIGEGEYALLDLVNSLENGKLDYKIKNVWFKKNGRVIKNSLRPLIANLDDLPIPDKELYKNEKLMYCKKSRYYIMTARGCPYRCSFCNNSFLKDLYANKGVYLRRRSVDNVIKELKYAKKVYKIKYLVIWDEIFVYDKKWLRKFSKRYKEEINVPFFCWVHPLNIDEEVVNLLKEANCREVEMGVQTIYKKTREGILNRYHSNAQVKRTIHLLKKANIFLSVDSIFGLPKQTKEESIDLARFYNENRVDRANVYWLRWYPKTEIVKIAQDIGILSESEIKKLEKSEDNRGACIGGGSFKSEFVEAERLILLTHLLPKKVINFLIEKRLCRFKFLSKMSSHSVVMTNILLMILDKFFWFGQRKSYPKVKPWFKFYLFYTIHKFLDKRNWRL